MKPDLRRNLQLARDPEIIMLLLALAQAIGIASAHVMADGASWGPSSVARCFYKIFSYQNIHFSPCLHVQYFVSIHSSLLSTMPCVPLCAPSKTEQGDFVVCKTVYAASRPS